MHEEEARLHHAKRRIPRNINPEYFNRKYSFEIRRPFTDES